MQFIERICLIIVAFAWTFLFGEVTENLFPDNKIIVIAAVICGISFGALASWSLKILSIKINALKDKL